jgi:hypothetical protein
VSRYNLVSALLQKKVGGEKEEEKKERKKERKKEAFSGADSFTALIPSCTRAAEIWHQHPLRVTRQF